MAAGFSGNDVTNDRVECGTPDVPASTGSFTMMCWSSDAGGATNRRFFAKASSFGGNDHTWMLSQGTSNQYRTRVKAGGTTTTVQSGSTSPINTWRHVACVYDGTNQTNFRNAVSTGSGANSGNVEVAATKEYWIGNQPPIGNDVHDGEIEDVRIYARDLALAELQTIFVSNGHDGIVHEMILRHPLNDNTSGTISTGVDRARGIGSLQQDGDGVNGPTWDIGNNIWAPRRRYR